MKLGVIGGGAMGEAIVASVIRARVLTADEIIVAERIPERAGQLARDHGIMTTADMAAAANADVLLVAIKPQDIDTLTGIAGKLPGASCAISIMAGVPVAAVASRLDHAAVVRAMPNTPAQIGEGMTLWTASDAVDAAAREAASQIFEAMGRQVFVQDEKYLDMATSVNGSGPGFVFLFIEAMIDAAVYVGFGRDLATEIVLQTVVGSARLAQQSGRHPADLRAMVTSPGGTTAAGLRALEDGGLRAAVLAAVEAAYNRSKSMGGGTGQR